MKFLSVCAMLLMLTLYPPLLTADVKSEISLAFDYLEQVWNEGDLEAIRSHYHSSFTFFSESAELNLKQRVEDLEAIMKDGGDRGELGFSDIQIRPLNDEYALVWGRSMLRFKDGTEMGGPFSSVYKKTPFGWKVVFTHN